MDISGFGHDTDIYNIIYLEIILNWPKGDHLTLRVISQMHRTRNFMDQSSAQPVKENKAALLGWGGQTVAHLVSH